MSSFTDMIDWSKPENLRIQVADQGEVTLIPTIVQDVKKRVLGLVYSSRESVEMSIKEKRGIFYSRKRGLWIKSPFEENKSSLVSIEMDCDSDALLFTVAQRGNFCHRDVISCFDESSEVSYVKPKLKIGICSGHSEQRSYQLLEKIGVTVYKTVKPRCDDFHVETITDDEVVLKITKPNAIKELLLQGIIDVAVCYEVNSPGIGTPEKKKINVIKSAINPVSIVAVKKTGVELSFPVKIVSEYSSEITTRWFESTTVLTEEMKNNASITYLPHTEPMIGEYFDIGIVVSDSGSTIRSHGLEIIDTVWADMRLAMYFTHESIKNHPRFFRYAKNRLCEDSLYFYSVDGEGGFLSNFYKASFTDINGKTWPSSEHYYQAMKFINSPEVFDYIASAPTPRECYRRAWETRYQHYFLDMATMKPLQWWQDAKDEVMRDAIRYKFTQNACLREQLIETGDKILVEHALRDDHYGCGIDENGKNMLGVLLMELRKSLK